MKLAEPGAPGLFWDARILGGGLVFAAAGESGVVSAVGGAGDVEGVFVLEFADGGGTVDGDVAGAGAGMDGGASAVDGTGDVMVVERALHHDGLIDVDGSRSQWRRRA